MIAILVSLAAANAVYAEFSGGDGWWIRFRACILIANLGARRLLAAFTR